MRIPALLLLGILALPPGDALDRAETLLAAGRPSEARAAIEEGLKGEVPPEARALLLEARGRCLRAEGSPWDAEAAFAEALDLKPDCFPAALGRGEVFLELARRSAGVEARALASDAGRWLATAASLRPGDPRPGPALAHARILGQEFAAAAAGLRPLIDASPKDAGLHHLLAAALRGKGDPAAAAAEEAAALALDPTLPGARSLRVGDLAAAGDPTAARNAAVEGLVAAPGEEDLYGCLWAVDAPEKRWDALEDAFGRVLARHPDQGKALHYLAYAQFSAGRLDAALSTFRKKAALEPGNPDPLLQIGRLLVPRGEYAAAESSFDAALESGLDPGSPAFTSALEGLAAVGGGFGQGRKYGDAERVFRHLVEREPTSAAYRMYLGLSLRRLARYEDAEKTYLAAIDLSPFDGLPRNELGLLYLGWGRPAEARRAFEESIAADPRVTPPLENLGNLALLEGRPEEAIARFREAYRRALEFRDDAERLKFRRYLDVAFRVRESAAPAPPSSGR